MSGDLGIGCLKSFEVDKQKMEMKVKFLFQVLRILLIFKKDKFHYTNLLDKFLKLQVKIFFRVYVLNFKVYKNYSIWKKEIFQVNHQIIFNKCSR